MIKLFVAVDLHAENGEPTSHTFCFNYGATELDNFVRAIHDYIHNHSNARYVELNVDGKPLYGEDIFKSCSSNDPAQLTALFSRYCEHLAEIVHFPLEKTG